MNTTMLFFAPCVIVTALAVSAGCTRRPDEGPETPPPGGEKGAVAAVATIEPKSGSTVTGTATLTADGDKVTLKVDVTGAPPGEHAVHIHEKGDCSAPDAMSAGEHWNPTGASHGKWGQAPFHLGDIGNMKVGDDGRGSIEFGTDQWTLGTGAMDDVVGRSILIHAQPDDFTTQPAGAAGSRLGCGVIRQR
jgi:Cu-Zn family superoxide dismutase